MLLVRTDANASIGVGHAMRCLALAESWMTDEGDDVTFAMVDPPDELMIRIKQSGARVERVATIGDVTSLARDVAARWAVIDGYHLGAVDQRALADTGARLLVMDDEGETASDAAAVVVNQNPYATAALYAHLAQHAELLLGPSYTLLRREFLVSAAPAERDRSSPRLRVLVSFGGADSCALTGLAIDALVDCSDIDIDVVVGAANPRAPELRKRDQEQQGRARVSVSVAVDDMASRMRMADVAIVAAGSTCWELAFMGVPMLVVATAPNQRAVARAVGELGIGVSLGDAETTTITSQLLREQLMSLAQDSSARDRMSTHGRALVDGRGASRVCRALRTDSQQQQKKMILSEGASR